MKRLLLHFLFYISHCYFILLSIQGESKEDVATDIWRNLNIKLKIKRFLDKIYPINIIMYYSSSFSDISEVEKIKRNIIKQMILYRSPFDMFEKKFFCFPFLLISSFRNLHPFRF